MPIAQILGTDVKVMTKADDHIVAMWQRTVIEVWRGVPTVEGSEAMMSACEQAIAQYPKDTSFIAVLERTSPPPTEPVRKVLARWSSDIVPRMAVAVLVSEGSSFRSAIVRGVGVALTLLAPHRIPFKFCSSVEEGVGVVEPYLGKSRGGRAGLLTAIEQTRSQLV
jgi:hypothetical protein